MPCLHLFSFPLFFIHFPPTGSWWDFLLVCPILLSVMSIKFLEFLSEFVLNTFSNTFYLHVWMFWLYVYMCTTYVQWPWRLEKNITPETGGRRRGNTTTELNSGSLLGQQVFIHLSSSIFIFNKIILFIFTILNYVCIYMCSRVNVPNKVRSIECPGTGIISV